MSEEIGDLAVRVSLDNTGFQNGMTDVNRALRLTNSEFKANTSALGNNASEMDKLRLKASSLTTSISQQRDKVSILENAHRQSVTATGANSRATQDLEVRLNLARASLSNMSNTLLTTNTQIATQTSAWTRLGTSLTGIGGSLTSVGDKMTGIGKSMMLRVTAPLLAIGVASGKMASDVEESTNKVDVAFGNNAQSVKDFSETTLKSFGIAKGSTLEMASLFGDMASGMGLNTEQASKMSIKLVGLAGDLASFKNIGISQAQTALKGIFTGEGESLKTLGVIMLDSTLKQFAMEKGIKRTYETMTQTEKVMLRYQYVLDKTKNSQGDFARTSDGTANSVRIFQESLKEFGAILGQQILPVVTPIIKKLGEMMQGFSKLNPAVIKTILVVGTLTALVAPLLIIFGTLISALGTVATFFGGMALSAGVASGATTALGLASGSAIPAVAGLGSALWLAIAPIMPFIGILGALGVVIGGVALHHKKQADEVKKTEEAYKKFNETLSGGSVKDLKEYEEELKFHQQTLIDLREKMEEFNKTGNSMDYNNAKIQLEDYIGTIEKQGYNVDKVTGKVVELSKVQNRINTQEQLDKVTEMINKRVDENSKIISLIDRYTQLNNTKERTQAEDIELSNTAKELNSKYSDLKISIDKNGNAIINNIKLLGNKKSALEVDIQMIKSNAYEQAKSAIYSEQIEIGKTKVTISEIERRIQARDAEVRAMEAQADRAGAGVGKRFLSNQEKEENKVYVDAYYRLQKIKEQISSINIPQASSGNNDLGFKFGDAIPKEEKAKKNESFETGIEATSKYSKVLVQLDSDLKKVDNNIKAIQNKIETSKTIGTVEELAKATKEQNNLYQAQIEKVNSLKNAEKVLTDNKKKLIQEFKSNFGALKNTDLNNWEETDFQNFIEKTYKQSTTTDKARAEALKKGQKYTQDLAKDLFTLNSKIESVGENLISAKKSQLQTLKELHEQEETENNKLVNGITKLGDSIKKSLIDRYKSEEELHKNSIEDQIEDNNKLKESTLKSIEIVYNAKMKILDDESKRYDIANNDNDDAVKEAELRRLLSMHIGADKRKEVETELNDLLKNQERRKYKESIDAQKDALKVQNDKDKINAEITAESNDTLYKKLLTDNEDFYKDKVKNANLDAETQKLIVSNNQNEIINLLKTYDSEYANIGSSMGESLVNAFKSKLSVLADVLNNVGSGTVTNTTQTANTSMLQRSNNNNIDVAGIVKSALSNMSNNNSTQTIIVPVYLDGKVIAQVTAPYNDKISGSNLATNRRGL